PLRALRRDRRRRDGSGRARAVDGPPRPLPARRRGPRDLGPTLRARAGPRPRRLLRLRRHVRRPPMVGGRGQPRRRQPGLLAVPLRQRQAVAGAFVDDDGRWHLRLHLALAAQGGPVMTVITGRALITGGS